MNGEGVSSAVGEPSLNLQLRRGSPSQASWYGGRTAAMTAGAASACLLWAWPRTRRYAVPATAVLLGGALALTAVSAMSKWRKRAADRQLDRGIAESFPASDPGAPP